MLREPFAVGDGAGIARKSFSYILEKILGKIFENIMKFLSVLHRALSVYASILAWF